MHVFEEDLASFQRWIEQGLERLERYLACWAEFEQRYPEGV